MQIYIQPLIYQRTIKPLYGMKTKTQHYIKMQKGSKGYEIIESAQIQD